ncbi:MAG: M23 family metallopeptidase [Candidatus Adiutrix sp.]|nr:M23 family metallopeptidase [Candidatus Adiutrix sp.]
MHKKKLSVCIIPNDGGRVRNLQVRPWTLPVLGLGLLAVIAGLGLYSFRSHQALVNVVDQSAELEALRFTNASQQAQLDVFAERVAGLDSRLSQIKASEMELASLTAEVAQQLGVSENTPLSELLPQLHATVAWADSPNGVGGAEHLAGALSTAAVAGSARNIIKGMHRDLDRLMMESDDTGHYLAALKDNISEARSILASTPLELPLPRRISADFGRRQSPFGSNIELHRGLDIPAPMGTTVKAPADGTVLSVGQSGGYGLLVTVDHGYGLVTRYAHLSEALVEPGAQVARGQNIALTGNSGRSTGPHLHYETILGGVAVDPMKMLPVAVAENVVFKAGAQALPDPEPVAADEPAAAAPATSAEPRAAPSAGESDASD